MKYKIVASDLDGTLLNSKARVSCENLSAISALSKKGVWFVPSTGRAFSEIPAELKDNADIRYVICSNGAVVWDKLSEKRVLHCISNENVRFILDVLDSCNYHLTMRHNGVCFVDAAFQTEAWWGHYNVNKEHCGVIRDYAAYLPDFKDCCRLKDNVEVFSAFFHNYADKMACRKRLEANKALRVVEATEYNLEIMSADAGKGNALCDLAQMLGVPVADTMAIGDSDNDNSMIRAAGYGLAVSNAADSLKSVADEMICSNEEHIVNYILSHFFNGDDAR